MTENRLPDYLEHMRVATADAIGFVEGMARTEFLADKRTQQAVIMSLIVLGEAATKVMDRFLILRTPTPRCRGGTCAACATGSPTAISR